MEKISNSDIKLIGIGKSRCRFEVGANKEVVYASPRVANDIINGADAYLERNITVNGNAIGSWLATPSRFN